MSSGIRRIYPLENQFVFKAKDGRYGEELWRSEGESGSTFLIKDLDKENDSSVMSFIGVTDTAMLFLASIEGESGLWGSNGERGGTYLIKDINRIHNYRITLDGITYFDSYTEETGRELWRTDGTAEGTHIVKDITEGRGSSDVRSFTIMGGELYFTTTDAEYRSQLWKTDGTEEGTQMLEVSSDDTSYSVGILEASEDLLYLIAVDENRNRSLWRSDGTAEGTYALSIPDDVYIFEEFRGFAVYQNQLFFGARANYSSPDLWKSDGETITKVRDFQYGGFEPLENLIAAGDYLYFTAIEDRTGREMWKSDGTTEGTQIVWESLTGRKTLNPSAFMAVDSLLYFRARDTVVNNYGLWQLDTNTDSIRMIRIEGSDRSIQFFGRFTAIFEGNSYLIDGLGDFSLYKIEDGIAKLIQDVNPNDTGNRNYSPIRSSIVYNDELYFNATDGTFGYELYKLSECSDRLPDLVAQIDDCPPRITLNNYINEREPVQWDILSTPSTDSQFSSYEYFSAIEGNESGFFEVEAIYEGDVCTTVVRDTLSLFLPPKRFECIDLKAPDISSLEVNTCTV